MPEVTFIIPAYNAGKHLHRAIDSILSQTVTDWELIIVDDSSKDDTYDIANQYAEIDSRIRVFRTDRQSGGAYIPRKLAISNAKSEIIAPLDSDDLIEPQYLQHLLMTMKEDAETDICYPVMYRWDGNILGSAYNHDVSLYGKPISGKEAVKYTLDGWRIHCNGGLIRKEVYLQAFREIDERRIEVRSYIDEYLSRILLFNARRIAICDEKYYYLENPSSITHTTDIRAFGKLWNNSMLLEFIRNNYSEGSEERILMERQNFHSYFDSICLLQDATLTDLELKEVERMLRRGKEKSDFSILKENVSRKYLILYLLPYRIGKYLYSFLAQYFLAKKRE